MPRFWRQRRCHSSSLQSLWPAQVRASAHWNTSRSLEVATRLLCDGYCVVHDAFPVAYLTQLRHEMKTLSRNGHLYPNATHIVQNGGAKKRGTNDRTATTLLLEKRGIWETELALPEIRRDETDVPFLKDFYDQQVVSTVLRHALPAWLGMSGQMVKVQYNAGQDACFPMHFDTYGDDGKCVTAVLYLNRGWAPAHGGELVLFPFPRERVVVQPQFGTLVLFSSQQMLHRVMPALCPRYALTTWLYHCPEPGWKAERDAFYRDRCIANGAVHASSDDEQVQCCSMIGKLLRSPLRRHLLKLIYAQEWTQSLRASHVQTDAFGQYMATHAHELQVIEAAVVQVLGRFRAKDGGKSSKLPRTKEELMQRFADEDSQKLLQALQLQWF
ncbi:unnamed protein product [Hyaloperonospora brassicae]|uniref:Fe2OG dioxygenase domain-containing protein n=1 Tax=Hyaloperonospora brassicae TaxID=162125 RepID=A0AAV0TPD5_HYABA|nr:unnamed protein product [Hyaloperonospora brassicae]